MNKRSKARWVRNLRDPKYANNQLFGNLTNSDHTKFCAIGVLINGHSNIKTKEAKDENGNVYFRRWVYPKSRIQGHSMVTSITKRAGLTYEDKRQIVDLNDNKKWSLPRIADWIEEHL